MDLFPVLIEHVRVPIAFRETKELIVFRHYFNLKFVLAVFFIQI